MDTLMNLFGAAVLAGTPLLLGMLGEILTQKSGHLNLGLEGTMYMGAAMSLAGAYYYEQWVTAAGGAASGFVACLFATGAAFLIGVLASLLYCCAQTRMSRAWCWPYLEAALAISSAS